MNTTKLNEYQGRIASPTVPGGQEFHFPHFFLKFQSIFSIFPQTLLIFFLILALRVGESPTWEGPGYATDEYINNQSIRNGIVYVGGVLEKHNSYLKKKNAGDFKCTMPPAL